MSYKEICRWLPLVLGLKVLEKCQAANQGPLLLMLGHLVKVTGHARPDDVCLRDFRKVSSIKQDRSNGKATGRGFGGVGLQGIIRVGQAL